MPNLLPELRLRISAAGLVLLALGLFVLPVRWIAAWMVSSVLHELGHVAALRVFRVRITGIEVGISGAVIRTEPMESGQELLCALAGPLVGVVLTLLGRWFPMISLCAFLQTVSNILPLEGLDGQRVLRCVAELLGVREADRLCSAVSRMLMMAIFAAACVLTVILRIGLVPVILAGAILVRHCQEKALANRGK